VHVVTPASPIDRLLPDTAWLDEWPVEGPLSEAEWERRVQSTDAGQIGRSGEADFRPGFTVRDGTIQLVSCPVGKVFSVGTVAAVPDLAADTDISVLTSSTGNLAAGFSRLIALCAVMLYRDAKGLPSASAAAQYLSALAAAKNAAAPIGALSLARRHTGRLGGFPVVGEVGTFIIDGGSRML
jgi:hypothetical protein